MAESDEIIIRNFQPESDSAYIYSSWSKYCWYSPKEPIKIRKGQFFKQMSAHIKSLLQNGTVKIACLKDYPYVIIGYVIVYANQIEWLCVKKHFHNHGVEELLKNSVKEELNGSIRSNQSSDEEASGERNPSVES